MGYSPNWQDHSTVKEAEDFHKAIGKEHLAEISGSRAHLRFHRITNQKIYYEIS